MNKLLKHRITAVFSETLVRQLVSGSLWSLGMKITSAGLTYLMFVLIARSMTVPEFGRFGFGFNLGTFLAVIASAGLHTAILRWVPEYEAQGRREDAKRALRWAVVVTLATGLIVVIISAVTISLIPSLSYKLFLFSGICLVLPTVLSELLSSALRANGSIIWAQMPRDVLWRLCGIGLACGSLLLWGPLSAATALFWLAVALLVLLLPQISMLREPVVTRDERAWPERSLVKNWLGQLWSYWGIAVIYASTQYVDVLLVGTFLSTPAAGSYFAASKTASLCALLLVASNMVSAPLISGAFYAGDNAKLQQILKVVSLCISIPTVAIVAALIIGGKQLLILFDPSFVAAYPALVILALAHGINGLCGPMSYVLQLTGHARMNLAIIAVCFSAGVVAQIILMPIYGITGAAIGSGGAIITWNLISWIYCRRAVGVDPTPLSFLRKGVDRTRVSL